MVCIIKLTILIILSIYRMITHYHHYLSLVQRCHFPLLYGQSQFLNVAYKAPYDLIISCLPRLTLYQVQPPFFALHHHFPSNIFCLLLPRGLITLSVEYSSFLLAHRLFLLTMHVSFKARLPQICLPG